MSDCGGEAGRMMSGSGVVIAPRGERVRGDDPRGDGDGDGDGVDVGGG